MADDNAADCLQGNLLELTPKIIKIAQNRNLASQEVKELLQLCQPRPIDDEDDCSQELNEGTSTDMCISLLLYCHYLCVCVLTLSLPNVTFGVFI